MLLSQLSNTLLSLLTTMASTNGQQITGTARALIYSATADFRHDSIPTAIQAMMTKGPAYNISLDNTEDQTWFTDDKLSEYDAIVFLDNTGQGMLHCCEFQS